MKLMIKANYRKFDKPTQVAFWDVDNNLWCGGIAYGTEIICGCCGGVIDIDELYEFAPEGIDPIKIYNDWVDINAEIIGFDNLSEENLDKEN